MAFDEDVLVRTKEEIAEGMLAEFLAAIPDAWTGNDSVLRLTIETIASPLEGLYIANQILREDLFVMTANVQALELYGEQYELPRKAGAPARGQLKFTGEAGTYIPLDTEVAYDPGTGEEEDILVFLTEEDGTIPSPGAPTALTSADSGVAGAPNGTYEHVVTFTTDEGETVPGAISAPLTVVSRQISLTDIPLGGAGTVGRRIYRRPAGGIFKRVTTITNNAATTFTDNVADGALTVEPPTVDSALAVQLDGVAEEQGVIFNVVANSIRKMTDTPEGVTSVTNPAPFTSGTDEEDLEAFRQRLLEFIQAPGTGSPSDVKSWAEEVEGVETATVFSNDNVGTPTNGHTTVRISGPDGTIPPQAVLDAVQATLDERGLANITYHVAAFTAQSTAVTVTLTLATGFILADVTPSVQQAIRDYINNLEVGDTLYRAGITDAVFGLTGVETLVVNTPASDQTTAATTKRTPGTITVN